MRTAGIQCNATNHVPSRSGYCGREARRDVEFWGLLLGQLWSVLDLLQTAASVPTDSEIRCTQAFFLCSKLHERF